MGRDKATLDLGGKPFIGWVVEAMERVCSEVIISGRDWEGHRTVDDHPGLDGPIAGLASALGLGTDILLVAVDQPWVRTETLRGLAAMTGTAVPIDNGVPQVTCARYGLELDLRQNDGSLQSIVLPHHHVADSVWRGWGEDGRSWFSVDTPPDLAAGLDLYGPPSKSGGPLA
jgi:molybdopterin-guanine dinucleotide biosynthesis protein A